MLAESTFTQPLKTISKEMTAWPSFYGFVIARKLHCLVEPMYLGVLVWIS